MAISNESKVYGYILSEVFAAISCRNDVTIRFTEKSKRSCYGFEVAQDGKIVASFGLFVKTSSKRLSPWRFTFFREHQEQIEDLKCDYGEVFIALLNGNDGVACFNYEVLKRLLDDNFEDSEWISVRRKVGEQYTVAGKDGNLSGKLPLNEFPAAIIEFINYKLDAMIASNSDRTPKQKKFFGLF